MDDHSMLDATVRHIPSPTRRALLRGAGVAGVATAFLAAGWTIEPVRAQDATPEGTPGAMAEPNAIIVLFGQPTDVAAFEEYYVVTHRPLALRIPGLQELLGGPILGTMDGEQSEYHRVAILRFASQAELEAGASSPEGQEAFGDVANFATGDVTAVLASLESASGAAGMATPGAATPEA